MFSGYWWLEALWGVLLILAPFVEKFSEVRAASYTSVILGIVVLIWAIVGYGAYWQHMDSFKVWKPPTMIAPAAK